MNANQIVALAQQGKTIKWNKSGLVEVLSIGFKGRVVVTSLKQGLKTHYLVLAPTYDCVEYKDSHVQVSQMIDGTTKLPNPNWKSVGEMMDELKKETK